MRQSQTLLLLLQLLRWSYGSLPGTEEELRCEPIKLEQCSIYKNYESTGMPNLLGHQLQGDAKAGLETFMPLIQYGCSPDLQFFLCSVHVPMCVSLPPTSDSKEPTHQLIGPCRPLCQRVKRACLQILQNFNLPWPEALNCDRFPPVNNHEHMCMDGDNLATENRGGLGAGTILGGAGGSSVINSLKSYPDLIKKYQGLSKKPPELEKFGPIIELINMKPAQTSIHGKCTGVAFPVHHHYVNRTGECVPQCGKQILFSEEDKHFAMVWLGVLAVLCLISTLFALVTFLLDTDRFLYPEKCVVFLNLSYLLLAMGYIVRLSAGPEGVACTSPLSQATSLDPLHLPLRLLVREGIVPTPICTLVFLLLYFSSLAAALWWALTTASWAVMVLCSLEPKVLENKSPLLHTLGWGVPALLTITALVMHQVEGDELTGVCLLGAQTDASLLHQLVIPHCIFLASAVIFFVSGLVGSFVSPSDDSRQLMVRLSLFFVLYTPAQACVVGSLVYEVIERKGWREEAGARPNIEVFILRIFMWLIVGVISGAWAWSSKSLSSWKLLANRCFGFWTGTKKPATPVFPTVAYQAAPGDDGGLQRGTLNSNAEARVVLGCADPNRIIL